MNDEEAAFFHDDEESMYDGWMIPIFYGVMLLFVYLFIAMIVFICTSIVWAMVGWSMSWAWATSLPPIIKYPFLITYYAGIPGVLVILYSLLAAFAISAPSDEGGHY